MTATDPFDVRDATDDAPAIAAVHATAAHELGSSAYDERQVQAWISNVHPERYPIGDPGFRVVVAERGDEVVGFGLLDLAPNGRDGSVGEISAVYVHPDHAREGVGDAIMDTLEGTARDAGLEALVLTASRNAIGFYERQGYEGVETVSLEMNQGVPLECLRMRKRLEGGE
ncbi:putative acetyltransferase [Halobiforma haloterrestris]|uniref:Putative acetyltransferase n=1 Tax=Natronobacterium haloterrestre TaxID=148448 RepID=A0A1I1E384_NATHA|nr:GNAT family N-acetyltransferase [Halobiforma haloterrestris]SFB81106.1 putative acetyltransferase [Halobiforma haloterrestris]